MTPQAKLKARFQELASAATDRFYVRKRKNSDYYVNIVADWTRQERYKDALFPRAYMTSSGVTSSGAVDTTYRLGPPETVERVLAEMEIEAEWLAWKDGTVVKIAREIGKSADFSKLPVLADSLEEAGCTNQVLLQHCRGGLPHFHSCWVVDLLVGEGKSR